MYATTEGYVREASIFRGRVGEPFSALPVLNRNNELITDELSVGKESVPKGIRTPVTALKGPCPGPG